MAVSKFERDLQKLILKHSKGGGGSESESKYVEREDLIEMFREIQAFRELEGVNNINKINNDRRSMSPL
jgi:hypothetical protein